MRKEAMHYSVKEDNKGEQLVHCNLCPHKCAVREGAKGICGVREHRNGRFETINYGEISSMGLDPIEKKPLYHYKPGSYILSVGTFGCNFNCGFCQNYRISKEMPETKEVSPEELVTMAKRAEQEGNIGIAFTYNEPSIWYEYVSETSKICHKNKLDTILVTNGYINHDPLKDILPYVDAMNIDLKAFNNDYYRKVCNGDLESVKATIELANDNCHIEITTLLVGGYNDDMKEIENLAKWIASLNPDIPLHISKYFPTYKFTAPSTKEESILRCVKNAKEYLHYVYAGNMRTDSNTYCYKCNTKLIDRSGYDVKILMETNKCPECGASINIIL